MTHVALNTLPLSTTAAFSPQRAARPDAANDWAAALQRASHQAGSCAPVGAPDAVTASSRVSPPHPPTLPGARPADARLAAPAPARTSSQVAPGPADSSPEVASVDGASMLVSAGSGAPRDAAGAADRNSPTDSAATLARQRPSAATPEPRLHVHLERSALGPAVWIGISSPLAKVGPEIDGQLRALCKALQACLPGLSSVVCNGKPLYTAPQPPREKT